MIAELKYMIIRILRMDYKRFFKTITIINKKTHISKIYLFFDMVFCGLVFGAGYLDYSLFEMYNMRLKERMTVVTRRKNNNLIKEYNDKRYFELFRNKVKFNERFNSYLGRDWMFLTVNNYTEFERFIENKNEIIIKPIDGTCGKRIEKLQVNKFTNKELFEYIIRSKCNLIEEVAVQHHMLTKLHPNSINTIRVVTFNNRILLAFLRIGNDNKVVDNFNSGGLVVPIDINTGKIKYSAINKNNEIFTKHPLTKTKIVGLRIPNWDIVKKTVLNACELVPQIKYTAWDVCVGRDKAFLIEGNEFPGHDLYQLPPHREENVGIYPLFKKEIKKMAD